MRHVKQLGESCGLACVAMLAGDTLENTALRLNIDPDSITAPMSLHRLLGHLEALGFPVILYTALATHLKPCTKYIFVMPSLNSGGQHFIVVITAKDCEVAEVLDPLMGFVELTAYTAGNLVHPYGIVDCGTYKGGLCAS